MTIIRRAARTIRTEWLHTYRSARRQQDTRGAALGKFARESAKGLAQVTHP